MKVRIKEIGEIRSLIYICPKGGFNCADEIMCSTELEGFTREPGDEFYESDLETFEFWEDYINKLEVSDELIEEDSLYLILASQFNLPCRVSKELLSVAAAPEHVAAALALEPSTPLLYSKLLAFSYNNAPIEIRESYIVTSMLKLYREF